MNPGPIEEAGKVATGIIDSMKSQPICLALLTICAGLLVILYFVITIAADQRQSMFQLMVQQQKETAEILSKCVVPARPPPG